MAVRNCKELGKNLQNIVKRLLANDDLCKLLYYKDLDPLSHPALTEEEKKTHLFNKLIKLVPRLDPVEQAYSLVGVLCTSGTHLGENREFRAVDIRIEVFVPLTQWMIKDSNLRPYAILGEVQESLDGKYINGLGKIVGGDFDYNFGTDEITGFVQHFFITEYD